jgi:hypothetical protein
MTICDRIMVLLSALTCNQTEPQDMQKFMENPKSSQLIIDDRTVSSYVLIRSTQEARRQTLFHF